MEFEWNAGNLREVGRHGLYPADVEDAMRSPRPLVLRSGLRNGEWRITLVGVTRQSRILVVVYTRRAGRIGVVTAYPNSDPRIEGRYRSTR